MSNTNIEQMKKLIEEKRRKVHNKERLGVQIIKWIQAQVKALKAWKEQVLLINKTYLDFIKEGKHGGKCTK